MDYYLILDGTVYGPYTLEEMKSLRLLPDTPVHHSSWPDDKWVYASDLLELRDCINDSQAAWRPNMTTPAADWIPAAYYLMLEGAVYGPYALSEMKSLQLFPDTPVHHSSWPDNKWVYASELPELRDCISVSYADAGRQETPSPDANAGDFVQPQPQPQPQPRPQPGQDNTNPGNENRPEKSGISPAWIILPAAAVLVIIAAAVIIYFAGSGGYGTEAPFKLPEKEVKAVKVKNKEAGSYKESSQRSVVTNVPGQNVSKKYNTNTSSSQYDSLKKSPAVSGVTAGKQVAIEGVLRMYLLNNSGEERRISEYYEADLFREYVAFVVETDGNMDVRPYLDDEESEMLDEYYHSAFMIVPKNFKKPSEGIYTLRDFASKYANKRVRAVGTFYVQIAGWRNKTPVIMNLKEISLVGNSGSREEQRVDEDEDTHEKLKYDYYGGPMKYNKSLFDSGAEGSVTLSNGDRLYYKYEADKDFIPMYLIHFYMHGEDIRNKYKVAVVTSLDPHSGYIGKDESSTSQINVMISVMGYIDIGTDRIFVIVKKK